MATLTEKKNKEALSETPLKVVESSLSKWLEKDFEFFKGSHP